MTPRAFSPVMRWLVLILLLIGGALFVWAVHSLIVPFLWAAIIAYIFNPLVSGLARRTGFHRAWFVVLIYLLFIGCVVGAVVWLLPPIRAEIALLPDTVDDVREYLGQNNVVHILGFRVDLHALGQSLANSAGSFTTSLPQNMLLALTLIFGSIVKILAFLVATFYFLLDARKIARWATTLVPRSWRPEIGALVVRVDRALGSYIRGQLILMGVMVVMAYVVMGPVLRLHYAIVLALTTGLLELFPVVGPLISWMLALLTGILTPPIPYGWSPQDYAIAILIAYAIVRQLQDNIVIPNVMGRTLRLHPALVLFVVLCGGYLGGLTGIFLAVPTTAVVRVLGSYLYSKIVPLEDRVAVLPDKATEQEKPPAPVSAPAAREAQLSPD